MAAHQPEGVPAVGTPAERLSNTVATGSGTEAIDGAE